MRRLSQMALLGLGMAALVLFTACSSSDGPKNSDTSAGSNQAASTINPVENVTVPTKNLGKITYDNYSFDIGKPNTVKTITNWSQTWNSQGMFVILPVTITNNGSSAEKFIPSYPNFALILDGDTSNKEYLSSITDIVEIYPTISAVKSISYTLIFDICNGASDVVLRALKGTGSVTLSPLGKPSDIPLVFKN